MTRLAVHVPMRWIHDGHVFPATPDVSHALDCAKRDLRRMAKAEGLTLAEEATVTVHDAPSVDGRVFVPPEQRDPYPVTVLRVECEAE